MRAYSINRSPPRLTLRHTHTHNSRLPRPPRPPRPALLRIPPGSRSPPPPEQVMGANSGVRPHEGRGRKKWLRRPRTDGERCRRKRSLRRFSCMRVGTIIRTRTHCARPLPNVRKKRHPEFRPNGPHRARIRTKIGATGTSDVAEPAPHAKLAADSVPVHQLVPAAPMLVQIRAV